MFKKLFGKKTESVNVTVATAEQSSSRGVMPSLPRLSIEEQKTLHKQRKQMIIDEFGKSVINFLYDEIWTPLHIIDFLEVEFADSKDIKITIENHVQKSLEVHRENLRGRIYKQSLNLQPGNLLMVVKDRYEAPIASFRHRSTDMKKLVEFINPRIHRLLLVRHFVPPIPDDLYKYDDVVLPTQFEEALKDIVNYCDLNYGLDNVNFDKWEQLVTDLSDSGVVLHLPNSEKELPLAEILSEDYSHLGYNKIMVKQIFKDTVEKNPIVIPLFVIFLAFFCSDNTEKSIFPYHYLFSATGSSKEFSITRGLFSFPKLFNQLLDESLQPRQFSKCLSIVYNESFRMRQAEIDDTLTNFREKYAPSRVNFA